jgi:predicted TIM-barrel fold metal-dependent hydrolase
MKVIDGDGHVVEPRNTFVEYIDPEFRERAPQVVTDESGLDRVRIDGRTFYGRGAATTLGASFVIGGYADPEKRKNHPYDQAQPGGGDPHARIKDLDIEGIDMAVLYPSIGLFLGGIADLPLAVASCRAYNDWLADYCKPYPDRLLGIGAVPLQDPDEAVKEMRRAVTRLGMHGVFVRPNPYNGRRLDDPVNDPFWAAAQELNCAVSVHEGTTLNMPTVGAERYKRDMCRLHVISHALEMQLACMDIVLGGVLEKFPRLRVAFLESGGGWICHWLDRLDSHYEKLGFLLPWLKMKPSEYFKRQCWISFDPDESTLKGSIDVLGADNFIWASDYPHFDCTFPGAVKELKEHMEGLSEEAKRKVLGENAEKLYALA